MSSRRIFLEIAVNAIDNLHMHMHYISMPNITIYLPQSLYDELKRQPVVDEKKGDLIRSMLRRKLRLEKPTLMIVGHKESDS